MRWAPSNESVDSTLLTDDKLRRVLGYMLDEKEFLGPFGIRSLSLHHRDQPYVFSLDGTVHRVDYEVQARAVGVSTRFTTAPTQRRRGTRISSQDATAHRRRDPCRPRSLPYR